HRPDPDSLAGSCQLLNRLREQHLVMASAIDSPEHPLTRYSLTPAERASPARLGSSYAVSITTAVVGDACRIRRAASMPPSTGMRRSRTNTSGASRVARVHASR